MNVHFSTENIEGAPSNQPMMLLTKQTFLTTAEPQTTRRLEHNALRAVQYAKKVATAATKKMLLRLGSADRSKNGF